MSTWDVGLSFGSPSMWVNVSGTDVKQVPAAESAHLKTVFNYTVPFEEQRLIVAAMENSFQSGIFNRVTASGGQPQDDLPRLRVADLEAGQAFVHRTVQDHLMDTLRYREQRQLLMLVYGGAGSGKTSVIRELSDTFERNGARKILIKLAPTACAAGAVDGQTVDSYIRTLRGSRRTVTDRPSIVTRIHGVKYIIIDHFSRMPKTTLALLSRALSDSETMGREHLPFGGRNVLIAGDVFGAPPTPVADATFQPTHQSALSAEGAAILKLFKRVTELHGNFHARDVMWRRLLENVRLGKCTPGDITALRGRVLHPVHSRYRAPPELSTLTLLTTRPTLAAVWNKTAVRSFCALSGEALYLSPASERGERLVAGEGHVAIHTDGGVGVLPAYVEVAVGMTGMAVGSRGTVFGTVTGFMLDPREPAAPADAALRRLVYPLKSIQFLPVDGSGEREILVEARTLSTSINGGLSGDVTRIQFPLFPAYALCGETIDTYFFDHFVCDFIKADGGRIAAHEAYGMLSRARAWSAVWLLGDFDDVGLRSGIDSAIHIEDQRLYDLYDEMPELF